MDDWTSYIQDFVYNRIKDEFPIDMLVKYPTIDFVTTDKNLKEPIFPTVKVRLLPMREVGKDFERKIINGVSATVQVDVTTNESEYAAQEIGFAVMNILVAMGFEISAFPTTTKETDIFRSVQRGQRTIGKSDVL